MTTQRRTSSPQTSPEYPDNDAAPENHRDEYPTEVFQPVWETEPEESAEDHWGEAVRVEEPVHEGTPRTEERAYDEDPAYQEPAYPEQAYEEQAYDQQPVPDEQQAAAEQAGYGDQPVRPDQATERLDPEYPTQVIEAFRDEPDHPEVDDGQRHQEQAYGGQAYDEHGQAYADQDYSEQGYAAEQAYDQQGYPAEPRYADEQQGYTDEQQGYADEQAYEQQGYADEPELAAAVHPEPAQPVQAAEPIPVAEQLFGTYEHGSDEYLDTAVMPRITDHGTIVDDAAEPAPVTAYGHDEYGADEYGADEYGADEYSADEYSADEHSAAGPEAGSEAGAEEPGTGSAELAGAPTRAATNDAQRHAEAERDTVTAVAARQSTQATPERVAEASQPTRAVLADTAPAASLLASQSLATDAHGGEPELLAGYAGDETVGETVAGQRSARPDDDEDRTELIPRYGGGKLGGLATDRGGNPRRSMVLALVLLLVTLVAAGGAVLAWTRSQQASHARPTGNIAFLDVSATAEAKDQVSKAIEAIYSYDSAQLDQSESNALSFITGSYADEFKGNFATVRQLAPKEKASLTSTVVEAGVESLTQSRATLLLMVNQVGHRGDNPQPLRAAVRLNVTAEKVDGQWKVSGVNQK